VLGQAPLVETRQFGDVPVLDVAASHNTETNASAIFIVNRHQTDPVTVDLRWQALTPRRVKSTYQLAGTDPKAVNTFDDPDCIIARAIPAPDVADGTITLQLPPLSFTALEVAL